MRGKVIQRTSIMSAVVYWDIPIFLYLLGFGLDGAGSAWLEAALTATPAIVVQAGHV
jgi:hypothetical protein